jgi:short-subunit dehydrogenase
VSPTPQPWSSALVTGASAGIGDAFARQLAAAGTDLVLVARRAERLESLADELRAGGVQVDVVAADLTDRADVGRVAERLTDAERPVDLLVNCAGLGSAGPFVDGDLDTYHQIVDLNVTALVDLTHAALGAMQERGRGWVLNVSSLGGHAPGPKFAVYSATKAFVTSFSESLYEELRGTGVHVTVVCPGATKTEFGAIAGTEADDLPALLQQSADEVVAEALAATAAGKAVKVTGVINRVSATVSDLLPRVANRRLSALVTDRL